VTGPDGNVWMGAFGLGIARFTPAGTETPFPLGSSTTVDGMVVGPDGNIWFTENLANKIGMITTNGTVTEFPIPTADSAPFGITVGPDGALWFVESGFTDLPGGDAVGAIGRITTSGEVTNEFPTITPESDPISIVAGPDGNLWFTESLTNDIARITPAGVITEFAIPTPDSGPLGLVVGPDGNLWFTEITGNKIGRLTL
jgi:virginiamycin B lyase